MNLRNKSSPPSLAAKIEAQSHDRESIVFFEIFQEMWLNKIRGIVPHETLPSDYD